LLKYKINSTLQVNTKANAFLIIFDGHLIGYLIFL
jgi:hypothetical protein